MLRPLSPRAAGGMKGPGPSLDRRGEFIARPASPSLAQPLSRDAAPQVSFLILAPPSRPCTGERRWGTGDGADVEPSAERGVGGALGRASGAGTSLWLSPLGAVASPPSASLRPSNGKASRRLWVIPRRAEAQRAPGDAYGKGAAPGVLAPSSLHQRAPPSLLWSRWHLC